MVDHASDVPRHVERLRARSALITALRQFFLRRGFTEVDTPVALRAPAPEVAIEAIAITICADHFLRSQSTRRFLQTSPELAMKRLLCMGLAPIFQIAPCFRDGDRSPYHAPEFRMLEWYRTGVPITALMDDCEQLIGTLKTCAKPFARGRAHADALPEGPWPRLTVDECFRRYMGFGVLDVPQIDAMRKAMTQAGLHTDPTDTWDELFFRAFVDRIEPALQALGTPVFVTHFPASQAALARLDEHDPRTALRFELYAGGMELANAFDELTCAREQRKRFVEAQKLRAARGMHGYPLDEHFLAALDSMPQACGIALGIERLLMLCLGASHIDEVSALPWELA